MAKQASLGRNVALNGIRTLFNLLFPLVTFPYVSRTLSVDNVGIYGFSDSIVSYFMMAAALGIYTYAVREGAKLREDRGKLERFASEVFTINMVSMLLSYALMALFLLAVPQLNRHAAVIGILGIQIFFSVIGTEWLYAMFEEFAFITLRSIAFQLLSLVLLFLLVKGPDDLLAYAGIAAFAGAGSNMVNFFCARRFCRIRLVRGVPWRRHLPPILVIFSTTVAISIYTCSDTTMLGFLCGEHEVGIYAVSSKIYALAKMLLSSVLIVAVPKLSLFLGEGRMEAYRGTLTHVSALVSLLLFPAAAMLFTLSEEFVLLLSDASYLEAASSLRLFCPALLFCLIGWIANDCVLIPARLERVVLFSTIVSASLNIALNFVLIPLWKADAAAFSTIAAEASVMFISVRRGLKVARVGSWLGRDMLLMAAGCVPVALACRWVHGWGLGCGATLAAALPLSFLGYAAFLAAFRCHVVLEGASALKRVLARAR
ncbi:MAG: oligosaccharide flippase family protein [Desulfovibrio sp.]|nr:oligosaccharide flippase family protein [Mailhella sp.]